MSKPQIFDLEKIKEFTSPIDELQGSLFEFEENINNFINSKEIKFKNLSNQNLLEQIQTITKVLEEITEKIINISSENISKFLVFQDNLMKKYRDSFKNEIIKLKINQNNAKKIGILLIENKKISKIIEKSSFIKTIKVEQWLEILDSLKFNSLFQSALIKCEDFYNSLIQDKLENELGEIPEDTDQILINDFKKSFLNNPNITFNKFLQNIEKELSEKEIQERKKMINQTKEKQKKEELIKKQEAQRQSYEDYMRLSNKEFEKMRRKRRREKLSDLGNKNKNSEELQISEEISEKIEKFKSKFENSFEEKYLVREDDDKDPLDLVRERKKEKEKEYNRYIKKFKKSNE